MSVILDASAATDILLPRPHAAWVAARLAGVVRIHVPHHFDAEIVSALRRLSALGEIGEGNAEAALVALTRLPVRRHGLLRLVPRAWELRHVFTPYDACYIALAERLGLPLVTTDARLARAEGHEAEIVAPA